MIRTGIVVALLLGCAALLLPRNPQPHATPDLVRRHAVQRGMQFLITLARDPQVFNDYGHDLLWCLYSIAETSSDPELSRVAREAAVERAQEFRRRFPVLPSDADAGTISWMAFGSYAADQIGVRDPQLQEQIQAAAPRWSARDYLDFDPAHEPPPSDVPEDCSRCGHTNARGATVCARCGSPLRMQSAYVVWYDALVATYTAEQYGVSFGASYTDVYRWASSMRPYSAPTSRADFYGKVYAGTHVVYTKNHYSRFLVDPRCLPEEYRFLKGSFHEAIVRKDAETMGEFLDSLRAFGMTADDPLIRTGFEFLLRTQNPDGSWGTMRSRDPYDRYHPTWTAIDGLRDYGWKRVLCPAQ